MLIKIIMGLPYAGKSSLAKEISKENSSCKIWSMNREVMNGLESFIEDFTFYSENYSVNILDGRFYKTECIEKVLFELSKYKELYREKTIEIHYFIPDKRQCILNEQWDRDKHIKENDINNIHVEEPNIKYLSSKFEFKINLYKHNTIGKNEKEVKIKHFVMKYFHKADLYNYIDVDFQRIYGYQWRNHNEEECEMCYFDVQDDINPTINDFKILKEFFLDYFNNEIPDRLIEELFEKYVYIDDIDNYCDYCDHKNRIVVCDLDKLYDFLDDKGLLTIIKLC